MYFEAIYKLEDYILNTRWGLISSPLDGTKRYYPLA